MLATKERPNKPVAAAIVHDLSASIREGRSMIGPDLASKILAEANYVRQRSIKPFRLHRHKTTMAKGQWDQDAVIRFAKFGDALILVDGQHRLTAVVESGVAWPFIVVISPVGTWAEVHTLYSRIDVDGNRSVADVLNAADPTAGKNISFEMRRGAYKSMDILANNFPHRRLGVGENDLVTKEDRVICMAYWLEEIELFDEIVRGAQSNLRQPMRRPGNVAVALATLKHQTERAKAFWSAVGKNQLLRPGDPEQALINFLLTASLNDRHRAGERAAAHAWNAWFKGGRLVSIKKETASDKPIKVAGTPYQGMD